MIVNTHTDVDDGKKLSSPRLWVQAVIAMIARM
jgi:hypothetical protein